VTCSAGSEPQRRSAARRGLLLALLPLAAAGCRDEPEWTQGSPRVDAIIGPPARYPARYPAHWRLASLPPAAALVRHDACPFECCSYGEWTAASRAGARTAPGRDEVAFTLPAHTRFAALRGEVHVTSLQRVLVDRPLPGDPAWGITAFDAGDVFYVLDYVGENHYAIWFRDAAFQVERFWGDEEHPAGETRVEGARETEWWVLVGAADGATGWIRVDPDDRDAMWHGADACALTEALPARPVGATPLIAYVSRRGRIAVDVPRGWEVAEAYLQAQRARGAEDHMLRAGELDRLTLRTPFTGEHSGRISIRVLDPQHARSAAEWADAIQRDAAVEFDGSWARDELPFLGARAIRLERTRAGFPERRYRVELEDVVVEVAVDGGRPGDSRPPAEPALAEAVLASLRIVPVRG
jgi:hypothetical protein